MAKANSSSTDGDSSNGDSSNLAATPASTGGIKASGGRTGARSKPYDANNSFVKKLGTKVSDLQRSWINKFTWFNNSQDERDLQNDADNEVVQIDDKSSQPPPSKRPCIRMDITHPPGTFDIKPRNRNISSNEADESSKEQFSNHNETTQDFLEPIASGSNFKPRFVASTPAFPVNSNNKIPYSRSALNMLMSGQNNDVATNGGTDDNSESGESTSGCSSLVPQNNRQDNGPNSSNFNMSPFASSKRRFTDDKMSFTNHLQGPRSLFLDSTARETLSSRQPTFNPLIVTQNSSFEKSSSLLSPFYPGNTMFGGANAANMFRKSKSLLANTSQVLNRTAPNRASVEVVNPSSSNASTADVSNMSVTARRILETLEQFSSPLSDAKKIPVRSNVMGGSSSTSGNSTMSSTLGVSRKRAREDDCESPKVGLRHLARELTVPTVPDIMRIRRKQRLQNTTMNARKIMSARNAANAPPTIQEYSIRTESDNETKRAGPSHFKATKSSHIEEEDSIEPLNLPCVPLPIKNLPRFDLPPLVSKSTSPLTKLDSSGFKFASPIKLDGERSVVEPVNNFTFSKPITPTKMRSESDLSRTLSLSSSENFSFSEKKKEPSFDYKNGSVMDFFNREKKAPTESLWECNECLIKNSDRLVNCVACKRAKPNDEDENSSDIEIIECPSSPDPKSNRSLQKVNTTFSRTSTKLVSDSSAPSSFFGAKSSTSNTSTTQAEIHSPSPSSSIFKEVTPKESPVKISSEAFQTIKSPLKSKVPKSSWQCPICMVHNSESASLCPCCNTAKPGTQNSSPKRTETETPKTTTTTTGFGDMFKKPEGSWSCDTCMIQNKSGDAKCVACETPKPGSKPAPTSMPIASGFGDKFKKPEGSWSCDSCMVTNKSGDAKCVACESPKPGSESSSSSSSSSKPKLQFNVDMPANAGSFKFGIDKADSEELPKTNGFSFGSGAAPATGGFTFGVPSDAIKTTGFETTAAATFQFGVKKSDESEKSEKSEVTTGFLFGSPKKVEEDKKEATFVFGSQATSPKATEKESKPAASTFVFGAPAGATSSMPVFGSQTETTPKPAETEATKPTFEAPKATPTFSFGATTTASTTSATSNSLFTFGAQQKQTTPVVTAVQQGSSDKPVMSFGSSITSPSFSSQTNQPTQSLFGTLKAAEPSSTPALLFGSDSTNKPTNSTTFGGETETKQIPTFCSTPDAKSTFSSSTFGTPTTSSVASPFGSLTNTPAPFGSSSTSVSFGGSSTNTSTNATPAPFGAGSSVFGTGTGSTFGENTATAPSLFGAAPKPADNTAATSGLFSFNQPASQPAGSSTSSGFSFSNTTTPAPGSSDQKTSGIFTFGATSSAQPGNGFGGGFAAASAPGTGTGSSTGFSFNSAASKQPESTPVAFGQTAPTTPMFSAGNPAPPPAYPGTTSNSTPASGGFNFGSTSVPNTFSFGGTSTQPSSSGFNFNAPSSATTPVTFDPNAQPTFNFTAGTGAPNVFNAPPSGTMPARKIKKAVRRMPRN